MAEEIRPEEVSSGVRRLLQEAVQLSQALDLVVASQGSGSPAVAPLVRELTATHRVLATAVEESTGIAVSASIPETATPDTEAARPKIDQLEDRLEETEARLFALKTPILQLLQKLEAGNGDNPTATTGNQDTDKLKSRNVELEREVARHRDVEVSLLTTMRDIRAASQAKSDFLANMSHELRTPLNAIIGFAEIMESELVGPLGSDQYVGYARDVRESGQYLLELINDILDLSKIESGQLEVIEETVDLRDTVDVCLRMVRDQATESDLTIDVEIGENVPHIRANTRMLRQVLLNLLSNAVKFTPSGGQILVSLSRDPDTEEICLSVKDSGIGIARDDIARVMRPFEQVAAAQSDGYRGTGLGLPMAKSLVELHGGVFTIVSEVGVGTTVTVRLPADRAASTE